MAHVSYALTRMGEDLTRHAAELLEWVRLSADAIELARRAFTEQDS